MDRNYFFFPFGDEEGLPPISRPRLSDRSTSVTNAQENTVDQTRLTLWLQVVLLMRIEYDGSSGFCLVFNV